MCLLNGSKKLIVWVNDCRKQNCRKWKPDEKLWICLYHRPSNNTVKCKHLHLLIAGVPGSTNPQDYIIVWGRNLAEVNEHFNKVFLKFCKSGQKLNKSKCQIGVKSIVFLGYLKV